MEFVGAFLNKDAAKPLYVQLYQHLAGEIRAGRLPAGERLPGKRSAAAQLGVSVNTVDEAYQQLAAEGYVLARPRSGFVVNRLEQLVPPPGAVASGHGPAGGTATANAAGGAHAATPGAHPPPNTGVAEAPGQRRWRHSFSSGGLDTSLFPRKGWNRLLREVLAQQDDLFQRGPGAGEAPLRAAIADYVRGYRGVRCHAGQVVVGAGLEVLWGMLARLLADECFALETPGYPKTGHILRNMGVAMRPVPVDEEGMVPQLLVQSGATVAYLTPSHQFPTGGAMPAPRRSALLQWAAAGPHWILEDDYDSEFRFDGRPLPCLQGLDEAGRVVYAGTFSRSLAPGLRAAYLVLPPRLLPRWQAAYGDYACTISRPEQFTLARFLAGGHFARSLYRIRGVYRRRRGLLLAALDTALPRGSWQAENTHTGLYFVLRLPGQNAMAVAAAARQAGLRLHALNEYRRDSQAQARKTRDALVVGYGGLAEAEVPAAATALAEVILAG